MTYFFETYGCQMNQAESSSVEQLLSERGWTAAESVEAADLILINTCSVRATAERRALARISLFCSWKRKRPLSILVMGCMAERMRDALKKKYPILDYVVGMFERGEFSDIFSAIESGARYQKTDERAVNAAYYFAASSYQSGAFQSYVPIMNGCNNFCSYCIVPYVRGREVSRSADEILAELDTLADRGVREVTLLGQNVNSYRWDDPSTGTTVDFPGLLRLIARRVEKRDGIRWVRFMSSHPKDLSDDLIEVLATERVFCRFLHLPIQHGSNRILSEMNRKYTVERYLSLVERVRARIPDIALSTDILVGFPGETEEDVQATLDLIQKVRFDAAFMYHYNPREGTKAFDMPNRIPDAVKKERLARVIHLQHATTSSIMRERVGKKVPVLIEGTSRNDSTELFGHTEYNEMVVFAEPLDPSLIGQFVDAELKRLVGRTFRAVRS